MRIKMTCEVEAKIKVGTLKATRGDWVFDFISNDSGFLEKIIIEAKVPDYTKYGMKVEPNPTKETPEGRILRFELDHEFNDILISLFQFFEGMLSLMADPVAVSWQAPFMELIAESDNEKPHAISAFRMQRTNAYDPIPEVPDNNIANMLMRVTYHPILMNPFLAFFREAERERKAYRFINTFFNAYFVLEGAYGNKQWKNWKVREEFKKSDEFRIHTQKVIDQFILKHANIERKIRKMLGELTDLKGRPANAQLDVDGIAYLLVETRGSLLHFSGDTATSRGTPMNHDEFEEIAQVAIRIAGETLWDFSNQIDEYVKQRTVTTG